MTPRTKKRLGLLLVQWVILGAQLAALHYRLLLLSISLGIAGFISAYVSFEYAGTTEDP